MFKIIAAFFNLLVAFIPYVVFDAEVLASIIVSQAIAFALIMFTYGPTNALLVNLGPAYYRKKLEDWYGLFSWRFWLFVVALVFSLRFVSNMYYGYIVALVLLDFGLHFRHSLDEDNKQVLYDLSRSLTLLVSYLSVWRYNVDLNSFILFLTLFVFIWNFKYIIRVVTIKPIFKRSIIGYLVLQLLGLAAVYSVGQVDIIIFDLLSTHDLVEYSLSLRIFLSISLLFSFWHVNAPKMLNEGLNGDKLFKVGLRFFVIALSFYVIEIFLIDMICKYYDYSNFKIKYSIYLTLALVPLIINGFLAPLFLTEKNNRYFQLVSLVQAISRVFLSFIILYTHGPEFIWISVLLSYAIKSLLLLMKLKKYGDFVFN